MSQDIEGQAVPGDEHERHKRAAELHEQIERLKSNAPLGERDRPAQPSPREFTEQGVREELEHNKATGEDS